MTDRLAPEVVQARLRGRFGRPYLYEPECESTQLLLLDSGLPEGAVAVTEHQTAGRGRLGRRWNEPPGTSVLCSVLLHPAQGRRPQELSLVAALAAAEAAEQAAGLAAQIKWPNDVLLEQRKVAGVLAELRDEIVVVGIGINVNQTDDEVPEGAASLRTVTGREHDRAALLAALLERLERAYEAWRAEGLPDLSARDFLHGRRVTADDAEGIAAGIDREGRFLLDVEGERRAIESGEITLRTHPTEGSRSSRSVR